ncbi:YchJ family protein [Thalassolituus maritimus]
MARLESSCDSGPCLCPCDSGVAYSECCERYHSGTPAPTPEALMRSRYSAFAMEKSDYLLATWHRDYRPQSLELAADTRWTALSILSTEQGDAVGRVHFVATFCEAGEWLQLEEKSRFEKDGQRWYYLAGEADFRPFSPGRNDPCPCGSDKKWKKCCGR